MIKAFATDLDGTFLNIFHRISFKDRKVIDKAIANNYIFIFASGRNFYPEAFRSFRLEDRAVYSVGCNGAIIKDDKGEIIREEIIDPKYIEELFALLPGQGFRIHRKDGMYSCYQPERKSLIGWLRFTVLKIFYGGIGTISKQQALEEEIVKIDVPFPTAKNRKIVDAFLKEHEKELVDAKSVLGTYEITNIHANKADGLSFLLEKLNLADDEVVVYGDSYNDVEMLKRFPNSYAPKNANEVVKPYVKGLVGYSWLDGVSRHIEKIIDNDGIIE